MASTSHGLQESTPFLEAMEMVFKKAPPSRKELIKDSIPQPDSGYSKDVQLKLERAQGMIDRLDILSTIATLMVGFALSNVATSINTLQLLSANVYLFLMSFSAGVGILVAIVGVTISFAARSLLIKDKSLWTQWQEGFDTKAPNMASLKMYLASNIESGPYIDAVDIYRLVVEYLGIDCAEMSGEQMRYLFPYSDAFLMGTADFAQWIRCPPFMVGNLYCKAVLLLPYAFAAFFAGMMVKLLHEETHVSTRIILSSTLVVFIFPMLWFTHKFFKIAMY